MLLTIAALVCMSPMRAGAATGRTPFKPDLHRFVLPRATVDGPSLNIDGVINSVATGLISTWVVRSLGRQAAGNGTYAVWISSTDAEEHANVASLDTADIGPRLTVARRVGPDEWVRGQTSSWGLMIQGEVSYRNIGFDATYYTHVPMRGQDFHIAQAWVERTLTALVAQARAMDHR
jgi:hypothetical protein